MVVHHVTSDCLGSNGNACSCLLSFNFVACWEGKYGFIDNKYGIKLNVFIIYLCVLFVY